MTLEVVYLDKIFIGNLAMNYVILWFAGKFGQVRAGRLRLLAGAGLGSLYAILMFFPGTRQYFSFYVKIVVSLLMVAAAFAPLPPRRMLVCLGFFYLGSFALGGMVMGFSYLVYQGGYFSGAKYVMEIMDRYMMPGLPLAVLCIWLVTRLIPKYMRSKIKKDSFRLPVTIHLWGKRTVVNSLVDTGNNLTDPVTGVPVMVVEYAAVRDILPEPMRLAIEKYGDGMGVVSALSQTDWTERLRLIPFRSLGNDKGLLLGIRPDRVEIESESGIKAVDRLVLAIHNSRLDPGSAYRALLHPDLLDKATAA